ncbi:hypothetical protein [Streptomyces sp. NPDC101234]|uniref:hypothetical protein n=1 Tax=Streptomyces sp. NPDC101234 TaxID=3366138 RepID=UPI00380872AE
MAGHLHRGDAIVLVVARRTGLSAPFPLAGPTLARRMNALRYVELQPPMRQDVQSFLETDTAMGYNSACPNDAFEAHRAFIARRRALRPANCDLRPATCDLRPATCNLQPATCNLQPAKEY